MTLFRGSGVAIVTPFTQENQVNYTKLAELVEWHVREKTDAIIACGTTGESPTITDEEREKIVACVVETAKKRIPVIAGTGTYDTAHSIHLSQMAEKIGADGLLCVTPYYNKPTQKGLIAHFTAIADAVKIPMIMYNVPSRTSLNMLPETIAKLAGHKYIRGVKEASGNLAQVADVSRLIPDDFFLYSGNDDTVVPLLSLGGDGVITTIGNILPNDMHKMVDYFLKGDVNAACDLQLKMKPLIDAVFCETNPIPIKAALNLMGWNIGQLRLPLTEMTEKNVEVLKQSMREYGLLQ